MRGGNADEAASYTCQRCGQKNWKGRNCTKCGGDHPDKKWEGYPYR